MIQSVFHEAEIFFQEIISAQLWLQWGAAALRIVTILIASRILIRLFHRGIDRLIRDRKNKPLTFNTRRTKTMGRLMQNVIRHAINFLTILLILDQLGFKLMPLLAGAGVVGLAIGFGAQNLVKDVITGFFILFEDQFAVGDVVLIGAVKGQVEEIGLRVTKIKSETGEIYIVPNGTIQQVCNFSLQNSVCVLDITVDINVDMDKAMQVLKATADQVYHEDGNVVQEPEVLGVQTLGTANIILRVTAECLPNTHEMVSRKLNERIKRAFDMEKIHGKSAI